MDLTRVKQSFFSAKCLTVIVLIVLPIFYISYGLLTNFPFSLIDLGIGDFPILLDIPYLILTIPAIPLMLMLLVYAIFPSVFSTPVFFRVRGNENVILEYQYIKKILYLSIIALISLIILYLYLTNALQDVNLSTVFQKDDTFNRLNATMAAKMSELNITAKPPIEQYKLIKAFEKDKDFREIQNRLSKRSDELVHSVFPLFFLIDPIFQIIFLIPSIPISIMVKLLLQHSKRQFRFYYAKGCFKIVLKETTSEIDKAKFLRIGLNWYNKYLKKNLGLKINDTDKILSKIVFYYPLNKNYILTSICEAFDSKNELEPLRQMFTSQLNIKSDTLLTKERLRTRLQESSDLLIPIITIIITIITTFFLPHPNNP